MTIEEQWLQIKDENILRSDIICFGKLITHNKFTEKDMKKWFRKLVDKNDYCNNQKMKEQLINFYKNILWTNEKKMLK